jgi:hypothetical protein
MDSRAKEAFVKRVLNIKHISPDAHMHKLLEQE